MKLTTIWTIPAMSLKERLRRTADWADLQAASLLPKRVKYWAFVLVGGKAIGNDVVPEARFVDLLARAEGTPRS